jgi:pimeloyl-ACP methyl ester carboxylesterase
MFSKPTTVFFTLAFLLIGNQLLRSPAHIYDWIQQKKLLMHGFDSVMYERDEYSLHLYERQGVKPIVVLPDLSMTTGSWGAFLQQIPSERGVVFVELLGHGDSHLNKNHILFDDLVESVQTVIDEIDEPVILVGHGLGGWLAAKYALSNPTQVEQLVMINSAGLQQSLQLHLYLPRDRPELIEKMDWLMGKERSWTPAFLLNDTLEMLSRPEHHAILEEMTTEPKLDQMSNKPKISMTLIWGLPNSMYDAEYRSHWSKLFPEATVSELQDCNHAPQYKCTTKLLDLIIK